MTTAAERGAPWTIGPPPGLFIDREPLLAMVDAVLEGERDAPTVVALHGLSGIGKTALVHRIAARYRGRFEIGLTVDFQSSRYAGAVPMDDAVAGVLNDLRVDPRWIPDDLSGKVRRFREATEGARVLVLLDGVSDAAQVSALIPNSRHGLVIVVSEVALTELADDGAIMHRVPGLDVEYGARLLQQLGVEEDQPERIRRLVGLVDGSPGMIRILAGHLRTGRGPSLAELVENLDRLASNAAPRESMYLMDRELIALFAEVYDWLPPEAAALYRLLGKLPGRTTSLRVVAAALDASKDDVAQLVATLVEANLVEKTGDGIFLLDLVRRHARLVAERHDGDASDRAVARAIRAWLRDVEAADYAIGAARFRVGDVRPPTDTEFGSDDTAMAWFQRTHDDLIAVLRHAAARELHTEVWRLFQAMWPFYSTYPRPQAQRAAADLAVVSAVADGNRAAEARMLCLRARVFWEAGDFGSAATDLDRATELGNAEHGPLFASVQDFVGQHRFQQGDYLGALAAFEVALAINERIGDQRGIALQTQFRGRCLGELGRETEALADFERAASLIAQFDDARTSARIAFSRAKVQIALERRADAVASLRESRDFAARLGRSMLLAQPLELLTDVARGIEPPEVVRGYAEQVVELHRQTGSPELDRWERLLAELSE